MSQQIGFEAEKKACDYLEEELGFQIVTRNYRTPMGEIDIIAIDKKVLVFVEVKYRKNTSHGKAYEYVTRAKIAKIKRAAWHFIKKRPDLPRDFRIDVVAMDGQEINYYKNIES